MYGIVANHPFLDGNKRTGLGLCLAFLKMENIEIGAPDHSLYDFTIAIASGQMGVPDIAAWLKAHTARPL
jgi:death-on-curing protein